jgi:ketosteroid isomerase-like protein
VSSENVPTDPETVVSEWMAAFNSRDLEAILARMDRDVLFHPLRLNGLERSYFGHDGMRAWFARVEELGHRHRIEVSRVRRNGEDGVLAMGELYLTADAKPEPFWGQSRVENGRITVQRHYLTLPGILRGTEWTVPGGEISPSLFSPGSDGKEISDG